MDALQVVAFQNASLHWPDWLKPVEDDGRYTEAVDQGLQIRMLQLGRTDVVVAKFGDGPYKAIFSIVSIIALALIVMGLRSAESIPMYDPPSWARTANYVGMFFAIYLVFSNSLGSAPSSAKVVTAHPMSWGVVFWSGGHLLANGDQAHVVLFGAFLIYGLISIFSGYLKRQKQALDKRPPIGSELILLAIVALVYIGLIWGHRYFTGMSLA